MVCLYEALSLLQKTKYSVFSKNKVKIIIFPYYSFKESLSCIIVIRTVKEQMG